MSASMNLSARLAQARSLLFVPGHRPERFAKALASGAGAIVLDLEDAVAPADKPAARVAVRAAWSDWISHGVPVVQRLNAHRSADWAEDEAWLATWCRSDRPSVGLAGLAPAIDGVTVALDAAEQLGRDTARARRFGFGGKLCIHLCQVRPVHAALAPSPAECDWARRVVDADRTSGGAAVRLDGKMIDRPVVLRAHRLLDRC
ncbi:citrate lyase beta subunit [Sphaerotilus sulfidivorans]|jgi:citrate lyase beta subunit|uniref:Citrate lyase beta subunit n=2 Tax=Sphaerotilus sulfidivorans TaxID=639200 RepID=A0ABV2IHM8_9BURK|nr:MULTISPECIES: aldolase/citrate lyase family protein [Sphaerotilus]